MAKTNIRPYELFVLTVAITAAAVLAFWATPARAAVTISSPVAGGCYKGGSTINIAWSSDDAGYHHAYVSYDDGDGSYPTYPDFGTGYIVHPASGTSYAWTAPSVTASNLRVYVEAHDGGHSNLNSMVTGNFSIDSSGPSVPSLSVTGKSTSTVSLSWTASSDAGCTGLSGYKVFRDNQEITSTTSTTHQDSGLSPATSYSYHIQAYDSFASSNSNQVSPTTDAATTSNGGGGGTNDDSQDSPTATTGSTAADDEQDSTDAEEPIAENTQDDETEEAADPDKDDQADTTSLMPENSGNSLFSLRNILIAAGSLVAVGSAAAFLIMRKMLAKKRLLNVTPAADLTVNSQPGLDPSASMPANDIKRNGLDQS